VAVRLGFGQPVDDPIGGDLGQPFQGKGRAGTVAQQTFQTGTVLAGFSAASNGSVHLDRTGRPDALYDTILDLRADGRWSRAGGRPEGRAANTAGANEPGACR